jgi:6-phosphofructokinase 1
VGTAAVDYIKEGRFGHMAALQGDNIVPVPLREAVSRNRTIDLRLYDLATLFY